MEQLRPLQTLTISFIRVFSSLLNITSTVIWFAYGIYHILSYILYLPLSGTGISVFIQAFPQVYKYL